MKAPRERPPRLPIALIARLVEPRLRGSVVGDLEERFAHRAARQGRLRARLWLMRQAIGFMAYVPVARTTDPIGLTARLGQASARVVRDLALAARSLRRRPGFTVPVIAVFAIAIAANTLVFSLVDAVLLRRLPYPDPESLALLWDRPLEGRSWDMPITPRHFDLWRDRKDLFDAVGAFETSHATVQWEQGTERSNALYISAGVLETLGARPLHGRLLTAGDNVEGVPPVAVLSYRTWLLRFGEDPDAVGRELIVNGRPTRIVGVLPESFWFYDPYMYFRSVGDRSTADTPFWMPLAHYTHEYDYPALRVLVRLRKEMSPERAAEIIAASRREMIRADGRDAITSELVPLREQMVGEVDDDLGLLALTVLLVLAVACSNVVSLLMSRSAARARELWVRRTLGAGDGAIARVILAESICLGLAGGAVGLALAAPLLATVVRMTPRDMPMVHRAGLDLRVAGATLALALGAGLVAGLVQTWLVVRSRTAPSRPGGERSTTHRTGPLRFALATAQAALSVALLIGASAAADAFLGLVRSDPGFRPERLMILESALGASTEGERDPVFFDRLLEGIRELPGVEDAAGGVVMPFSGWGAGNRSAWPVEEQEFEPVRVSYRFVTPGYFRVLGIPLRRGRTFTDSDASGAPPVVVVSDVAGRALGLEGPHLGAIALQVGSRPPDQREVIGVVGDVAHGRLGESPLPVVYVPAPQAQPIYGMHIAVRARAEPLSLAPAIRALARELDVHSPVGGFQDMEALLPSTAAQESFFARLLGVFGGLALFLACAGLYGMVAYAARLRRPEMGVRKALGARPGNLQRLMLGHALRPVGLGLVLGIPGAIALNRVLAATVEGLDGADPVHFVVVLAGFAVAAFAAAIGPARDAAAVDPVRSLRETG